MDTSIGFVGADYVLFITDKSQARSILKMKGDLDKTFTIDTNKVFALSGDAGDRENFAHYIQKNIHLYQHRTGLRLSTKAAAHFARGEMAKAIRESIYQANVLIGGVDEEGASLYYLDYLGSLHKMPFAVQGYASNLTLSIFDRYYKKGLSVQEGLELARLCVEQLKTRFLISQPDFVVKIVDKEGVRELPSISV
uniref:Proteasome subunit beta n=1 Tax=Arcella intermedia TaxID=1963864 RepID=A0A6B2LJG2_9EUKA|eukprot:TRINITY_DN1295_c0_g1_i1.p2 TRINITY_DN1295_c0_g1~~TRINITY_DN1295_c0_g1_i1.p2  ORF type:complete len:195 (-),score=23.55 TRINITY_DN1295_c0_g1_i1:14-598(-)